MQLSWIFAYFLFAFWFCFLNKIINFVIMDLGIAEGKHEQTEQHPINNLLFPLTNGFSPRCVQMLPPLIYSTRAAC